MKQKVAMNQSQLLERFTSYDYLLRVTLNIVISNFHFGYIIAYLNSISFSDICDIYSIKDSVRTLSQGLLTGCILFSGAFGSYFSSYLLTRLSRKQCFLVVSSSLGIFTIFLLIPNLTLCFIVRCLQGVCIGIFSSIASIYVRQFVPTQLAGKLCPWTQIATMGGIAFAFLFTYLLSLILPVSIYWRIVFMLPALTSLYQIYNIAYKYPYETPKWFMLHNKKEQTKQLLSVIYKQEYVQQVYKELANLVKNPNTIRKSSISHFTEQDIPNIIDLPKNSSQTKQIMQQLVPLKKQASFKPIKLESNTLAIIAAVVLHTQQQMAGSGALISYSGEIVRQIIPSAEKVYPIFLNSFALCGTLLTLPTLRMLGRKNSLIIGSLVQGLSLMILTFCFSSFDFHNFHSNSRINQFLICFFMILVRFVYSFTTGPVVWIYVSQTVQSDIFAKTMMINWLLISLINTLFPILKQALENNFYLIFLMFGVYTCLCCICFPAILIETQGKSQSEIKKQYQEKWEQLKRKI